MMSFRVDQMSEPRRRIIQYIKNNGSSSMSELASYLDISGEGVRQHLLQLEKEGWVNRNSENNGIGRPVLQYRLTTAGEHLFEKNYDHLTIEVLDTLSNTLGEAALKDLLSAMIEQRIHQWERKLDGLNIEERLNALKDFYKKDDSYMEIENKNHVYSLIERNCPFHNVALQRPILCSVSVSVLTHLLGCSVKREKRLQNGDGCCVFQVQLDEPISENTPRIIMENE
ncbi:winged helix-turn-helix transcriptional regulator [Neobacillus niacini]|uniref:helix-turn-helix transcriptional regulator n=2 Tax=Neobacillus niacini TaxID=86668 RepID=UPI0007ABFBA5|nr:winged helix-turn-helix transcriptional regulator [Neobacillus niacini]MEC1524236.1 winged helix-turn-helix transcriptional regulator [Neobacillus niacini]